MASLFPLVEKENLTYSINLSGPQNYIQNTQ